MGRGWVRGIEDALRRFNTHVVRVPEAKEKENEMEAIFDNTVAENFQNW